MNLRVSSNAGKFWEVAAQLAASQEDLRSMKLVYFKGGETSCALMEVHCVTEEGLIDRESGSWTIRKRSTTAKEQNGVSICNMLVMLGPEVFWGRLPGESNGEGISFCTRFELPDCN
ncbi:hypothetical protein B7P43_G10595 [Cryptotermes secundus]|uniref:Uncharacterized protein n=1 Tax=Cryptotermes secundus TaxID=105785 RepID=A0A2J7Q4C3_9NEOP|nr:hypothetical protein B7P43_G10595 [Cryptotermes secundus]